MISTLRVKTSMAEQTHPRTAACSFCDTNLAANSSFHACFVPSLKSHFLANYSQFAKFRGLCLGGGVTARSGPFGVRWGGGVLHHLDAFMMHQEACCESSTLMVVNIFFRMKKFVTFRARIVYVCTMGPNFAPCKQHGFHG